MDLARARFAAPRFSFLKIIGPLAIMLAAAAAGYAETGGQQAEGDWRIVREGTSSHFREVVWNGARFVAVGSFGGIAHSSDGIEWAKAAAPVHDTLSGVAWGGGRFVAVGNRGVTLRSATGWRGPRRRARPTSICAP